MQDKAMLVELRNLLSPVAEATNALEADGITSSLIYDQIVSTFDGKLNIFVPKSLTSDNEIHLFFRNCENWDHIFYTT